MAIRLSRVIVIHRMGTERQSIGLQDSVVTVATAVVTEAASIAEFVTVALVVVEFVTAAGLAEFHTAAAVYRYDLVTS